MFGSKGNTVLVKGVSLVFMFLGALNLCDNKEGFTFSVCSFLEHTFLFRGDISGEENCYKKRFRDVW